VSRLLIPCAAALLLVAACGDEGSHDRTRGEAQQMQGEAPDERIADDQDVDQPITVALTEFSVELDRDTVSAGTIRFRVRNNGADDHALAIEGMGLNSRTDIIAPGDWAVLDVDLEPGNYEVYCPIETAMGEHAELGMRAVLTVQAR
jgi:uncharacterized cupredoxin-like copper-binding protein